MSEQILTADAILNAIDLEEKIVEVPEWNGAVKIKGFTKAVQQKLRRQATVNGELDTDRFEMLMFIHGVSEPQFSEDQYEALRNKSAAPIDRVLREVMGLAGLTEEVQKQVQKSFRPGPA